MFAPNPSYRLAAHAGPDQFNGVSEWSSSDLAILVTLVAASGLLLVLGLFWLVRASPPPPPPKATSRLPDDPVRPRTLAQVIDEGYELIELYDDVHAVPSSSAPPLNQPGIRASDRVVRTAKVLNRPTGRVELMLVKTPR